MLTILAVNLVVVALVVAGRRLRPRASLGVALFVVFLLQALRYDYGNDYRSYFRFFEDLAAFEWSLRTEPGWQVLCLVAKPLGFTALVALVAGVTCVAFYRLIVQYVPEGLYWIPVYLYLFTPGLMLINMSAMRQCLAGALFMLAIPSIEKNEVLKFLGWLLLASSVHYGAMVLLPAYALAWSSRRVGVVAGFIVVMAYLGVVVVGSELRPAVAEIVGRIATRYGEYQESTEIGTGLGVVFRAAVLVAVVWTARRRSGPAGVPFQLATGALFVESLGVVNSMAVRIGMLLGPAVAVVVPHVYLGLKDKRIGGFVVGAYALFTMYTFLTFFESEVWREAYRTYQTVFAAPSLP